MFTSQVELQNPVAVLWSVIRLDMTNPKDWTMTESLIFREDWNWSGNETRKWGQDLFSDHSASDRHRWETLFACCDYNGSRTGALTRAWYTSLRLREMVCKVAGYVMGAGHFEFRKDEL
ncbi:hypothetical protein Bpfe_011083 [Biomphalaria pfeifferi]|uniref:Uncharacterized protein n=1 Tax=Biomphalaria pfeifferi TaxID=112525 RepID=A0AAD8BRL9_BIOPF|nr:hypothetical protein Bpfe_011083 [Biomphalaria pfeifferi]